MAACAIPFLRNYAAAQPKSSNFPAMLAEFQDALNFLSANSYNQNAAGWRKADRSTARPPAARLRMQ
jgi:hypothetical protein